MAAVKICVIALVVYVGIVITFETALGYFQPSGGNTIVITTTDADGTSHDRVVARLESNGRLYVARNHWPRAWYNQAREDPSVQVTFDGGLRDYRAVPVFDEEYDRVNAEHKLSVVFRILTGFPARHILRLDQQESS